MKQFEDFMTKKDPEIKTEILEEGGKSLEI